MAQTQLGVVLRHLHRLLGSSSLDEPTDGQLLDRFVAHRDEAAFEELLRRHGPMVLGTCRRLLAAGHDADDVFQATFLVFVHKAASIRKGTALGCWLYGVAYRLALKARAGAARRRAHERRVANMRRTDVTDTPSWDELRPVLDEELARLPERLRAPLVLCYLEGKSNVEAARELGRAAGSMSKLLARGREVLRRRLTRRGVALSAGALAVLLAEHAGAAVPAELGQATLDAGLAAATGAGMIGVVSARVAGLVQGGLRDMFLAKCKLVLALVLTLVTLGFGTSVLTAPPEPEPKPADEQQPAPKPAAGGQLPAPQAKPSLDVNGDKLPAGALARLGTVRLRQGHNVQTVAFSPDGKSVVSAGHDHLVRQWEVATGRQSGSFGQRTDQDKPFAPTRWLYAVAFAPDGKTLATGDHADGWQLNTIRLWDAASGAQLKVIQGHTDGVLCVTYSPDGKTLASASNDGSVRLWDPATGAERHTLAGHQGGVRCVAYSRDGKRLASAGADGTVRVWDADKGTELRSIAAHEGGAGGVAFSPDGKQLVSGGADKVVRLWDASTGKELRKLQREKPIRAVAFSPDGRLVACGGGIEVLLWGPETGKEVRRLKGPRNEVRSVAFSPDGKHVAAAAVNHNMLFLWEAETGKRLHDRPGHEGGFVGRVGYSADGATITSVSGDATVRRWDVASGKPLSRLEVNLSSNRAAAVSPDGRWLAVGVWNGTVYLLDAASGREVRHWEAHTAQVTSVAFAPDGKSVASCGADQVVRVWDPLAGKELQHFDSPGGAAGNLVYSPNSKLLACVVAGQPARLFDVAKGEEVRVLNLPAAALPGAGGGGPSAESAAFSPDGRLIATGDRSGTARVWDVATGQKLRDLPGLTGYVMGMAFSPDGRTLAAGGWRGVRLYEVATGKERRRLDGHEGDVTALAFAPDGRTLVSGSGDTTALVWDVTGRLEGGKLRPADLSRQDLELAWTDLRGQDAARAYPALWLLAAAPKQALPLLREALPRAAPVAADRLAELIADLDDDDFTRREKATDELAKVGEQAEPALKKALEGKPSVEMRRRLDSLLERMQGSADAGERLRQARALEVLEAMGTPEARALLEGLAKGAADAWLTREAQAALARRGKS